MGLLAKRLAPTSLGSSDLCNSGWRGSRGAGSSPASPSSSPRPQPAPESHAKGQGPPAAVAGEALAGGAPEKGGKGREYLLLNASRFGSYSSVACGESCPSFCSGLAAALWLPPPPPPPPFPPPPPPTSSSSSSACAPPQVLTSPQLCFSHTWLIQIPLVLLAHICPDLTLSLGLEPARSFSQPLSLSSLFLPLPLSLPPFLSLSPFLPLLLAWCSTQVEQPRFQENPSEPPPNLPL